MNRIIVSTVLTTCLVGANALVRAEAPAGEFAPMEYLVGHCWSGQFRDGKATDTHCFDWMLGGHFLRDRHTVKSNGPDYSGETIYFRNSATKKISFRYLNTDGGISDGALNNASKGVLLFEEVYRGPDGAELKFQTDIERMGDTQYQTRTRSWDGKNWADAWAVTFTRVQPGDSAADMKK